MGIDFQSLRFIRQVPRLGDVLTLGHQEVMISERRLRKLKLTGSHFADGLLRQCGAKSVRSLDYSRFEAADFIWDLNQPLIHPLFECLHMEYEEEYDTIIDGGTLEHVFNLPQALATIMQLVRIGGHLIIDTPTNNWCGHGFYQFSPELFFSTLNRINGFTIERMVIHRVGSSKWYEVLNPLETGRRTELCSRWPMTLKVLAKRVELRTPFAAGWPQQSDYVRRWEDSTRIKPQPPVPSRRPWWSPVRTVFAFWGMSVRNRKCFRRIP